MANLSIGISVSLIAVNVNSDVEVRGIGPLRLNLTGWPSHQSTPTTGLYHGVNSFDAYTSIFTWLNG